MIDDEKRRADARENRDHILEVARDALATDPAASLNSIAKAAGVGAGTLYRHFPSRGALVLGVYRKEIDELVALAPWLLTQHAPLQALRMWCDRLATSGRMKHGVADILHAAQRYLHPDAIQMVVVGDPGAVRAPIEKLGFGRITMYDTLGHATS